MGGPAYLHLMATVSPLDPYCFGQVVIIHEGQQATSHRMDGGWDGQTRGQLVASKHIGGQ